MTTRNRITNVFTHALAAVACIALMATWANAADITWGTPQDITGELTDFSTDGSLVLAYSGDTVARTVTGLGITFTSAGLLGGGVFDVDREFNFATVYPSADADYDNLLNFCTWNATGPVSLSLGGLISGKEYQLQIWGVEARDGKKGWETTYGDGNGNNVLIKLGDFDPDPDPIILPQYVIGTFTADGTTQNLEFLAIGFTPYPRYNALQLRDITPVATPGTLIYGK